MWAGAQLLSLLKMPVGAVLVAVGPQGPHTLLGE
jgi:hypothetical protein